MFPYHQPLQTTTTSLIHHSGPGPPLTSISGTSTCGQMQQHSPNPNISSSNGHRVPTFWPPTLSPDPGYGRYTGTGYYHSLFYASPFGHVGNSGPTPVNPFYSPSLPSFSGLLSPIPQQSLISPPLNKHLSPSFKLPEASDNHVVSGSNDCGRAEPLHSNTCSSDVVAVQHKLMSPNSRHSSHEESGVPSFVKSSPSHQSHYHNSKGANCLDKVYKSMSNNKYKKSSKSAGEYFNPHKYGDQQSGAPCASSSSKGLTKQCNNYLNICKNETNVHAKDTKSVGRSSVQNSKKLPVVEAKPLKINVDDTERFQGTCSSLPSCTYKSTNYDRQMIMVPPVQHQKQVHHSVEKLMSPSISKAVDASKSNKPSAFTSVMCLATSSKQPELSSDALNIEHQTKDHFKSLQTVKKPSISQKVDNIYPCSDEFTPESAKTFESKICGEFHEEKYQRSSCLSELDSDEVPKTFSVSAAPSSGVSYQNSSNCVRPLPTEYNLNTLKVKTESQSVVECSKIKTSSHDRKHSDKSCDRNKKPSAIPKLESVSIADGANSSISNPAPAIPIGIAVGRRRNSDQAIKRSESVCKISLSRSDYHNKLECTLSDQSKRDQKGRSYIAPMPPTTSDFPLFIPGSNTWPNTPRSQAVLIPPSQLTTTTTTTPANNNSNIWSQATPSAIDSLPNIHPLPAHPLWLSPHTNPALSSFTHHPHSHLPIPVPTIGTSPSPVDPSHLPIVPVGYQLTRDPVTGHVFLIPATPNLSDLMDRWSGSNSAAQYHPHAPVSAHHYQQLVAEQHVSSVTKLHHHSSQQADNAPTGASNNHDCELSDNDENSFPSKSSHNHHSEPSYGKSSQNEAKHSQQHSSSCDIKQEIYSRASPITLLQNMTSESIPNACLPNQSVQPISLASAEKLVNNNANIAQLPECEDPVSSENEKHTTCGHPNGQLSSDDVFKDSLKDTKPDIRKDIFKIENGNESHLVIKSDDVELPASPCGSLLSLVDKCIEKIENKSPFVCDEQSVTEGFVTETADQPIKMQKYDIQSNNECMQLPTLQVDETPSKESKKVADFIDNHGLNLLLNSIEEQGSDEMPTLEKLGGTPPFHNVSTDDELSIPPLISPEIIPRSDQHHRPFRQPLSPDILPNIDPINSNGLGLLCALAEQRFKEEVESVKLSKESQKITENTSCENDLNHNEIRPQIRDRLPSTSRFNSFPHTNFASLTNISILSDGQCKMYSSELEREIADVQRKYKERQRELAKLKLKKPKEDTKRHLKRSSCEYIRLSTKVKTRKKLRLRQKILSDDFAEEMPSPKTEDIERRNHADNVFGLFSSIALTETFSHDSSHEKSSSEVPSKIEERKCSILLSNDDGDDFDNRAMPAYVKTKQAKQTDELCENLVNAIGSKRKPGRPKKHSPVKDECVTETIVAKKLKPLSPNKFKTPVYKEFHVTSSPKCATEHSDAKKVDKIQLSQKNQQCDEFSWNRRRSERIFLSEHHQQDCEFRIENKQKRKLSSMVSDKSQSPKKTKPGVKKPKESLKLQDFDDREENETNKIASDGPPLMESDKKNCCTISVDELKDGLRVLIPKEGLFYQGRVSTVSPPDLYKIMIDGERGNKGNIYSQEEILRDLIIEKKVENLEELGSGTRICASWSQQYKCLYPGTVAKCSSPHRIPEKTLMDVEFDDGDSGRIELCEIFLLPSDYPIVSIDPNPIMIGKRRRRASSGDVLNESNNHKQDGLPNSSNEIEPREASKEIAQVPDVAVIEETVSPCNEFGDCVEERNSIQTSSKFKKFSKKKVNSKGSKNSPEFLTVAPERLQTVNKAEGFLELSRYPKLSKKKSKKKLDEGKKSEDWKRKRKKHNHKEKSHHRHHRHKHHHKHHKKHRRSSNSSNKYYQNNDDSQVTIISQPSLSSSPPHLTVRIRKGPGDQAAAIMMSLKKTSASKESSESSSSSTNSDKLCNSITDERTIDDNEANLPIAVAVIPNEEKNIVEDKSSLSIPSSKRQQTESAKAKKAATAKGSKFKKTCRLSASAVESCSRFAAFLPAKQIWRWSGEHYRRNTMKGKAKKVFYKSITRGKEIIQVGDSAVFLSTGRPNLPYIGHIESMWESWGGNMIVKVKWFYHPLETNKVGNSLRYVQGALYQSTHEDENDVQTISHRCHVLPFDDYMSKLNNNNDGDLSDESISDQKDTYYLAGSYEPTTGILNIAPNVATK